MLPGVGCVPVRYCTAQNMAKVINGSDSSMANSSSGVNPGGQKEPSTEQSISLSDASANDVPEIFSLGSSPSTSSGVDPDSGQGEPSTLPSPIVKTADQSSQTLTGKIKNAGNIVFESLKSLKLPNLNKDGRLVKTLNCKDCDAQHQIPLTDNVNLMEFRCDE